MRKPSEWQVKLQGSAVTFDPGIVGMHPEPGLGVAFTEQTSVSRLGLVLNVRSLA